MWKEVVFMMEQPYRRYVNIQQELQTDEEYLYLMDRLRQAQPEFQTVMDSLTQEHREAVYEYLGILGELSHRTMEIGCYVP